MNCIAFSHLLTKTNPGERPWLVTVCGVGVEYSNVSLTNVTVSQSAAFEMHGKKTLRRGGPDGK